MKESQNIEIFRTDTTNQDYKTLVEKLDLDLRMRFGKEQEKYDKLNIFQETYNAVIASYSNETVACGAWRKFDNSTVEIKRMYVSPSQRGKGIATRVLTELEKWAGECGYNSAVLECGTKQPEAIGLYIKNGYFETEKYGEYKNLHLSICFRKLL